MNMNINMNTNIHKQSFKGGKRIEISQKDNANMKYLFNHVSDVVKKNKVPAVFNMGEGNITITTFSKKLADTVTDNLKKLGIVSTTPKK